MCGIAGYFGSAAIDDGRLKAVLVRSGTFRISTHNLKAGRHTLVAAFVDHAYRHSTVTTIYGGSSEVQRGIIAEPGLGLPRSR